MPDLFQRCTVAYIGNFVPEHSTENHVAQAWERKGHNLIRVQEGDGVKLDLLTANVSEYDLILWTRTGDLADKVGHAAQWALLTAARKAGVPTVAFHLDRWWGLDRQHLVWDEPFFRCEYVITADGGHQEEFATVGVNHFWLPPAVSLTECDLGKQEVRFSSPLAFVGSWRPGYHAEWTHRPQLITWLNRHYRNRVKFWPEINQPSVRGEDLRNLYASTQVVIGDSCLVGNATRYWSDRIPETVGRGGFLIHPYVEGIEEHFTPGEHLITWPVGDWAALQREIERALHDVAWRQEVARRGRTHVLANHTYDVRVNDILRIVKP